MPETKIQRNEKIKELYETGDYSLADLALEFKIHRQRVYMILNRDKFSKKKRTRGRNGRKLKGYTKLFKESFHVCVHCRSTEDLTVDHIIPISKGGESNFENLQILCRKCNLKKSNKIYAL